MSTFVADLQLNDTKCFIMSIYDEIYDFDFRWLFLQPTFAMRLHAIITHYFHYEAQPGDIHELCCLAPLFSCAWGP